MWIHRDIDPKRKRNHSSIELRVAVVRCGKRTIYYINLYNN